MSAVAENIQTQMPEPIVFTDNAAAKVADLIAEEGNPDLKLRVFVQGGGCSGFQYGFTFDEITNEDDTTMSKNLSPHSRRHAEFRAAATAVGVVERIIPGSSKIVIARSEATRQSILGAAKWIASLRSQ